MFNSHKNKQTYNFGDGGIEDNPYAPTRAFNPEYQAIVEEPQYYDYQMMAKENMPRAVQNDPKRAYAQELLTQMSLKNQKKAEELYEKEQMSAMRQWEMQQFREEEERKKTIARQKTRDYREMLELQSAIKMQLEGERKDTRAMSEPTFVADPRMFVRNNRVSGFNPITGEPYEINEDPSKMYKASERSLANYGNLVVQARRPY